MSEPTPTYKTADKAERKPWRCSGCGEPMPSCYVLGGKLYIVTEELTIAITGLAEVIHNGCDGDGKREWHTSEAQLEELMRAMGRLK